MQRISFGQNLRAKRGHIETAITLARLRRLASSIKKEK
jgi:hypothetical protein